MTIGMTHWRLQLLHLLQLSIMKNLMMTMRMIIGVAVLLLSSSIMQAVMARVPATPLVGLQKWQQLQVGKGQRVQQAWKMMRNGIRSGNMSTACSMQYVAICDDMSTTCLLAF
jgi:hypothetical protein